ncbi:MAG: FKBP-type peptidyl-prolyl cis-trans isomerase SlyD [Candidatus Woesearchaeota archaeon]|nr:FKBP-type peptidyl-prolyl cis-trans isomerase SlyD [Candidatus Woesearchaeota archaeon]MDN5327517.1 FKBP-type peptidyl-prolyl cis-trans isomerase SlyD [Candidatus Woesearchaeota archaeon]
MKVENNKKVSVEYTAMDEQGNVFDTNVGKEPLKIIVGAQNVVPGFEENLIGMEENEEKEFDVPPEKGYGPYMEELVTEVEKSRIPNADQLVKGTFVQLQSKDGYPVIAYVKDVTDSKVVFDLNHPFAGKNLHFKVKILKVEEPTKEELLHGHVHDNHNHEE